MKTIYLLVVVILAFVPIMAIAQYTKHHHQHEQTITREEPAPLPDHHGTERSFLTSLIVWLGQLHLVATHFPIALIMMTMIAEGLNLWRSSLLFQNAARFMLIAAVITIVPTILFGFAHAYGEIYSGDLEGIFWWHRFLGVATGIMTVMAVMINQWYVQNHSPFLRQIYYVCLVAAAVLVSITGYLGGEMAFGIGHLSF